MENTEFGYQARLSTLPISCVVVMSVIFEDVHDGLNLIRGHVEGLDFSELLYADDTVLIVKICERDEQTFGQSGKMCFVPWIEF